MKRISAVVMYLSGRQGKQCYTALTLTVGAAVASLPKMPRMKELCGKVCEQYGKKPEAVWKAVGRAAEDIWEYGDRKRLETVFGRRLRDRPTPKELVTTLSLYVWFREPK